MISFPRVVRFSTLHDESELHLPMHNGQDGIELPPPSKQAVEDRVQRINQQIHRVQQGLARMRTERGWSQAAVARMLGGTPNQSTISLAENSTPPKLETLLHLQQLYTPNEPERFWVEIGLLPQDVAGAARTLRTGANARSSGTQIGTQVTSQVQTQVEGTPGERVVTLNIPLPSNEDAGQEDGFEQERVQTALRNPALMQAIGRFIGVPARKLEECLKLVLARP